MKSFFQELQKRRVYRVALAYAVAASAMVQVASTILTTFHVPDWVQQAFVVFAALGFPIALVLAWGFDINRGTIERTTAGRGKIAVANNRRVMLLGAFGGVLAVLAVAAYWTWHSPKRHQPDTEESLVRAKSIAVLPFANLSGDQENAYFTDGVQDEILTGLAKVADLKVISRTSVMPFKANATRNVREIAKLLGVANVVEGNVQRSGQRVRVSAQLIDARTDTHLWAEQYERDLADVFAIQSEVAKEIVGQLQAKLTPAEKSAIELPPTVDLPAYDLYLRAKTLVATAVYSRMKSNRTEAIELLTQAIARDRKFFAAYCLLATLHDQMYLTGLDHTPQRLALAGAAVDQAQRLRPDAGEVHLARAAHLYYGYLDYDGASTELALAQVSLPNEPRVWELAGFIDRRRGKWEESIQQLKYALQLDPRNFFLLQQSSQSYQKLRRYDEAIAAIDHALSIEPNDTGVYLHRASLFLEGRADPKPLHAAIDAILARNPNDAPTIAHDWVHLALSERDFLSARRAVAALPPEGGHDESFAFPRSWYEGLIARAANDGPAARTAFEATRAELQKAVDADPNYAEPLALLGVAEAALGHKETAIKAGQRALELLPVAKDSVNGAYLLELMAIIYAWNGEKDLALNELELAVNTPSDLSYGRLRLHPVWDPLRGDVRFERLVTSLAPK